MTNFDYEREFEHYLYVIQKVMDPNGSFLELGSGNLSLSDHFSNVTILDSDVALLMRYIEKEIRVIQGDYHFQPFQPNSFDYVVAIHPASDYYMHELSVFLLFGQDLRSRFSSKGGLSFVQ